MSTVCSSLFQVRRRCLLRLTSVALLVGCNVYDESLLPDEPAGSTTGGGPGVGGFDGTGSIPGNGGNGNTGSSDGGTSGNGGSNSGGGGNDGNGGSGTGGTGGSGTGGSSQLQLTLISDMEAGNNEINLPGGDYWFTTGDDPECISPNVENDDMVASVELPEARPRTADEGGGDSLYAMHFVGTNCTGWGAQAGFRLKANGSYDASDFDGIAFWARLGSEGAPRPLRVELADVSTHPDGGLCVEVDPEPGEDCFAHYFTNKQLNADPPFWTFFKIPFTEFGAPGFGYHQTDEPQPDKLYQILFKWQPSASANFDVWIDDVYFYKEP